MLSNKAVRKSLANLNSKGSLNICAQLVLIHPPFRTPPVPFAHILMSLVGLSGAPALSGKRSAGHAATFDLDAVLGGDDDEDRKPRKKAGKAKKSVKFSSADADESDALPSSRDKDNDGDATSSHGGGGYLGSGGVLKQPSRRGGSSGLVMPKGGKGGDILDAIAGPRKKAPLSKEGQ
jgi:hypothetical protein